MSKPLTIEDFLAFYPQFTPVAHRVVKEYIHLANQSIDEGIWQEWTSEGRRLFAAHKCTLYAKTQGEGAVTDGLATGSIASHSVDGVSVSYTNNPALDTQGGWGDLKTTEYGIQLATYARRLSLGVYVG